MKNLPNMRICAAMASVLVSCTGVMAEEVSDDVVRIGVISDMSGPYSTLSGMGVVRGVQMAVEEAGGTVAGKPVEVIWANYQGKVDIAVAKSREWFDAENVDVIVNATDSASALAISQLAAERKKPLLEVGAATAKITGDACTPYSIQWTYNTQALAVGTVRTVAESDGKSWYIIQLDHAAGQSLADDATRVLESLGGEVVGVSLHPFNAPDFSSLILQAQASGADVVAMANTSTDTQNSLRQAVEFGLSREKTMAALLVFDQDIRGLGLDLTQGLKYTTAFYWDRTDASREFSERFMETQDSVPSMVQAGAYSAVAHYLRAIDATSSDNGDVVLKEMRETTVNDIFAQDGYIRADGQFMHDFYLAEVKSPDESESEWDIARIVETIPADKAYRPLSESDCPLVSN